MIRLPTTLLATFGVLVAATASAQAGEFEITINVDVADRQISTEETAESPTTRTLPPRPVAELTQDQTARVSWHAENTGDVKEFKEVLVHFFVVREEKTGQAEVPKLTKDVTYEGALTMDFKPHENADWQWTFRIHEPGSYLLRVETIGLREEHGHEHYAAMDLVVK